MINIGSDEATDLERDDSSAKLAMFKAFRLNGSSTLWKRTRYSGGKGGVTGKANTTAIVNDIVLYVARSKDVTLSTTASGTLVPDDQYEFAAPGNPDVQTGDIISDKANAALTFTVKSSTFFGYDRSGIIEQRGKVV